MQRNARSKNLKLIYRSNVTGTTYSDYALVARDIEVSDELELEAVSGNQHDQYAVKVYHNGVDVGWLSNASEMRKAKEIIWRMLTAGLDIRAVVMGHDRSAGYDSRLFAGCFIRVEG